MKYECNVDDKNKITVMHVAQAAGGVERYLMMFFKYVNKEKFRSRGVCSQDFDKNKFESLVDNFIVIRMKNEIGLNDISACFKLRRQIKKYNPDIVYAHSSKAGVIARLADFGMKNKIVYNPHGWAVNMRVSKLKKFFYIFIERLMSHFCNKIVCISEAEKESALKYNICAIDKLQVIDNGIDVAGCVKSYSNKLTRKKIGIPNNAIIIGTVGRLSEQKAPDIFIKVAEKIKKDIPNAYFIMVGDGNEKKQILQYANLHGIGKSLLITEWVDNALDYIKLFDVAVLFSRWEGFGLVLAEYMLCGVPIVTTNVDAIPYIIKDHENGLLVNVDDIKEGYDAIIELIKNDQLRKKLIDKGKKMVIEKYDVRRVVKEHDKLFFELLYK